MPHQRLTDQQQLERLIFQSRHPCVAIATPEEGYALSLLRAAVVGAKEPLWMWSAVKGLYPGLFENSKPLPNTENAAAALYSIAEEFREPVICVMLDLIPHVEDARTLRALRDVIARFREQESCLILLDYDDRLPGIIAAKAARVELSLPDEQELERLIRNTLKRVNRRTGKVIEAKLARSDLQTIIRNLRGLTRRQAEQIIIDAVAEDQRFDAEDINTVLAHKRRMLEGAGVLEYVEAPVSLDEVGGLAHLKKWLRHRRDCLCDAAVEFGLTPPRGLLLLGVQGAGKSLSAKAIATAWQRPLLRLDPGTLYDRYMGESERRLRDALKQAEMMAPIVLWIDEIEKGFASAAAHSVDGGLSQRMFGTLLTWMQDHREPVFLVATANNIEALPPELLRKGRFDEIFFVDLPGKAVRKQIFSIHLRKRKREPTKFDLNALAGASEGFSGAEIEQAIIAALHESFSEKAELDTAKVLAALQASPTLSVTAVERIHALRSWAQGRCVMAE
jgi:SpoVK/Ycf46/Vps4 family AAA+-type ATPase